MPSRGRARARRTVIGLVVAVLAVSATALAQFSLVSVADEVEIGRETDRQVRQQVPVLGDRQVAEYIESIGRQLAANAPGAEYPYTFTVADYAELNAFALPGGPVWVHRGVLQAAGNEAQVAAVLGHEIAHIAERHAADQLTKSMVANGLLGLLGALLGNEGGARTARIGAGLLANGVFLKFSRDDEREADRVGMEIVRRAGWDPRGMVEFLQLLQREQGRNPSAVETFLSTHPSPEGRVERLQAEAQSMGSGRRTSRAFTDMQRRLRQLPPAQRMKR